VPRTIISRRARSHDDAIACEQHTAPTDAIAYGTPSMTAVGLPTSAVMQFGDPNTGSPFPPADGHDASIHAKDKMVPRTVVIAAGGTVTFEVAPIHRVAVYDDGKTPEDVSLQNLLPAPILGIPNFQIDDANARLALQPAANFVAPRVFTYAFPAPGRYLVICVTTPHFVNGDMWGWVIVK
jgi:plastocyanin